VCVCVCVCVCVRTCLCVCILMRVYVLLGICLCAYIIVILTEERAKLGGRGKVFAFVSIYVFMHHNTASHLCEFIVPCVMCRNTHYRTLCVCVCVCMYVCIYVTTVIRN
jgi:hypothetical protein